MPYFFKICLIGDFAVGKTSLARRFLYNEYQADYQATIGVNISKKEIHLTDPIPAQVTLVIWDLAGGEPFTPIVEAYYRGAAGALFVADITRPATVEHLSQYIEEFRLVNPDADAVVLLNKVDLLSAHAVEAFDQETLREKLGTPIFLTSARTGYNVENAFLSLARRLLEKTNHA